MFPEHTGALDLLQSEVASSSGLVGVNTQDPALVGFVTDLRNELNSLSQSQQQNIIGEIQSNISNGVDLQDAVNGPLQAAGFKYYSF